MPEKVSFFHGKEENVAQAITNGRINGSDFVVTSDTDNLIYVNKEQVGGEEKLVQHVLGSAKTKQPLTVNLGDGGALGGFSTNDEISAGTSLDDIIKKLLVKRIPATYTRPTVSIACPKAGSYEVGTNVEVGVTGTFKQNDGGAVTKMQVIKNGATPAALESATSPITYAETLSVPDGNTTYKVIAEYGQGVIKKDNLGDDSPAGRIEAGSVTSSTSTITGFRKAFYGAGLGDPAITTSDNIRTLGYSANAVTVENISDFRTDSANAVKKGTTFSISVPEGQQFAVFAYPKSIGEVAQVMYVETNDTGASSKFTRSEVNVCGATAEQDAIAYYVYSYKMAVPASANMTFKVTL